MPNRNSVLMLLLLTVSLVAAPPRSKIQGYCERGGRTVSTLGYVSTTKVQESFPFCTVTVYTAGVLKPLPAIYEDDLGNLKIGNPFTADADGYYYFYADDGRYDVRFSGAGILPAFTRGDFQTLDWRFVQPGLGTPLPAAVARSLKLKLAETLSVKDFGAKGDGTTDDTAAIQAAITTVSASSGEVLVPCGHYKHTGLSWTAGGVRLTGQGRCSWLDNAGAGDGITVTGVVGMPGLPGTRFGISHLRLTGRAGSRHGIRLKDAYRGELLDLYFPSGVDTAIYCDLCSFTSMKDIVVTSNIDPPADYWKNGIRLRESTTSPTYHSDENTIINPIIEGVVQVGIYLCGNGQANTIVGGTSEANGYWGIKIEGQSSATIVGTHMEVNGTGLGLAPNAPAFNPATNGGDVWITAHTYDTNLIGVSGTYIVVGKTPTQTNRATVFTGGYFSNLWIYAESEGALLNGTTIGTIAGFYEEIPAQSKTSWINRFIANTNAKSTTIQSVDLLAVQGKVVLDNTKCLYAKDTAGGEHPVACLDGGNVLVFGDSAAGGVPTAVKVYTTGPAGVQVFVGIGVPVEVARFNAAGLGVGKTPVSRIDVLGSVAAQVTGTIQGAPGQSANIWEFRDGTGAIQAYVDSSGQLQAGTKTFAGLAALNAGALVYCSDCQVTNPGNNTCAGGGTGALAVRILPAAWRCFANQN